MADNASPDQNQDNSIDAFINRFGKEKFYEVVFHALMDTETDSIYIKDCDGCFRLINRRVSIELDEHQPVIGKSDSDMFGKEFGENTHREEQNMFASGRAVDGVIQVRGDAQSGLYWSSTSKIPLKDDDGNILGLIGITRNINELKIREQKLQILATHDPMTNVYNRAGLVDRLDDIIHQSGKMFAVLAIDLDNFKRINDTYLHKTGDEFLIWFAWLLKTNLRGNDIVARLGGDEFVVILNKINQEEDAGTFCNKLNQNYDRAVEERFKALQVGMSIGISIFPNDSTNPDKLLEQADKALYDVKQKNKGEYKFFSNR